MKLKYLILLVFLFGCKTKQTTLEQNYSREVEVLQNALDSISEIQKSIFEEFEKNSTRTNRRLVLTPVVDSNGIAQPIQYVEIINGIVVRQINLQGASLEETNEAEEVQSKQTKLMDSLARSTRSESDFALRDDLDANLDFKDESKPTKGSFWSRFKLWIIIILLLVLLFLSWRLKLFRR